MRRLEAVELWEISIVTFPLLAGARVHAVKAAHTRPHSHARLRAERDWRAACGGVVAVVPAPVRRRRRITR